MSRDGGLILMVMLATLANGRSREAIAADWSNTLESSATAAYLTNPQLTPGGSQPDRLAQLSVDGSSTMSTDLAQLALTPRFSLSRYDQEKNLNANTGSFELSYQQKLERGQWTLDGQALTDSTITSELGQTGVTDINRHHYLYSTSVAYVFKDTEQLSWQVQGAWQDTRYSDALKYGLTDFRYITGQFGPTWAFSETLIGTLNIEADELTPSIGIKQDVYSVSLQAKHSLTEHYTWRLSAGTTRVDAGAGGSGRSETFEVGITRLGQRVTWDLDIKRAVLPIGFGLLARQDTAALGVVGSTSEHSALSFSVNAIRSKPVFFYQFLLYSGATYEQLNLEWRYQLSPHWTVSCAYVRARQDTGTIALWGLSNQGRLGVQWQSLRL